MHLKYELICMDLDGTLLDEQKRVSDRARRNLQEAAELGIQIALLSGRMIPAIELIEEQIGLSCIKGGSAGTYVMMDGKCIVDTIMTTDVMQYVYEAFARKYDVPLWIYKGSDWYVSSEDWYVQRESRIIDWEPIVEEVSVLKERWDSQGTGPNKLMFGASPETLDLIKAEMDQSVTDNLDYARSNPVYLEIFPKGANKGSAVQAICDVLQIDLQKTIAFGDQELDIPMLDIAGFGVAMENSPECVKSIADAVTGSNENDGVAIALENYVLG